MMFQDEYKNAYDQMKADAGSVEKILESARNEKKCTNKIVKFRPVTVTMIFLGVLLLSAPVLMKGVPTFFAEEFVWGSASDSTTDTERGVVMTVESLSVKERKLSAVISFSNAAGSNFINGEDEYIVSISAKLRDEKFEFEDIKFLGYDAEEEKLYYSYTVQRPTARDVTGEEVSFSVKGLFAIERWQEELDLTNVETEAETRVVKLFTRPRRGNDVVKIENKEYPYEVSVLNMTPLSEIKTDETQITGIAYMDGMLRIQICNGDSGRLNDVLRTGYVAPYNEDGEVLPEKDENIYWYEKVNGKVVEFTEYYYVISEEEARELPWVIEFNEYRGYFDTTWKVQKEVE